MPHGDPLQGHPAGTRGPSSPRVWALAEMEFMLSIAVLSVLVFPTVLCVGSQEGVENTPIWPLLSSAPRHQGSLQQSSRSRRLEVGKILGGDMARTAGPN